MHSIVKNIQAGTGDSTVKLLPKTPVSCVMLFMRLRLHLHFQSSFLLMHVLGGKRKQLKCLGTCYPCGRPRRSSWLLASACTRPSCWEHLGNELEKRIIQSLCSSLCFSFPLPLFLSLCLSSVNTKAEDLQNNKVKYRKKL